MSRRRERSYSRHTGRRRSRSRNRSRRMEERRDTGSRRKRSTRERYRTVLKTSSDRDPRHRHRSSSRRYRAPEQHRRGSSRYQRRADEVDYYRQRSRSKRSRRRVQVVFQDPRKSVHRSRDRVRRRSQRPYRSRSRIVRRNSRRAGRRSLSQSRVHSEDLWVPRRRRNQRTIRSASKPEEKKSSLETKVSMTVPQPDDAPVGPSPAQATRFQFPTDPKGGFASAMSAIACNAGAEAKGIFSNLPKGGEHFKDEFAQALALKLNLTTTQRANEKALMDMTKSNSIADLKQSIQARGALYGELLDPA